MLINKWCSWVQSDFTCNLTLLAIWLYVQSDFTCNPPYVQSGSNDYNNEMYQLIGWGLAVAA